MKLAKGIQLGSDGKPRCWWCVGDPLYESYHDSEWGRPQADDRRLFEKIALEGFQAGLSWITILRKRENFRAAFAEFDIERIARFGSRDVNRLLGDAGIVRYRGKIESVINNAHRCLELIDEHGSLASYIWQFEPSGRRPRRIDYDMVMQTTTSEQSIALSKDLRKRGWSYVGPTTMYAFMQSVGLVNDHLSACPTRALADEAREKFVLPIHEPCRRYLP